MLNSIFKQIRITQWVKNLFVFIPLLVSGSYFDIAQLLNCQLICTESKFSNGKFDKILGKNCYGDEKVRQIKLKYNIDEYDEILVFGDSKGDYEMSKIGKYHHKFFNLKKI